MWKEITSCERKFCVKRDYIRWRKLLKASQRLPQSPSCGGKIHKAKRETKCKKRMHRAKRESSYAKTLSLETRFSCCSKNLFLPKDSLSFFFFISLFHFSFENHRTIRHCEVATISRLPKNTGLFYKRALWKRPYSAKETYICKEPTNISHPISLDSQLFGC